MNYSAALDGNIAVHRCNDTLVPVVCIVVLNYNGRDHLKYCLPSIAKTDYPNYRLIVVDNASSDDSVALVNALCPDAWLIKSDSNRGWSGGNNLGIAAAIQVGAKYVVLINNDIRVDPRWLDAAVEVAEQDPRVGVVGFQVFEPESGGDDREASFEQAKVSWKALEISYPKYVGGMAMFVRAEVFEQIGLIDEDFFAYGEENDFQIRARKAGYSIVATNVPVWHYGQGSFGRIPTRAALLQTRNNIRLLIKHGSVQQIIQAGVRHLRLRCLPSKMSRTARVQSPVERRLRPSNFLVNFAILLYAVVYNLLRLPATLRKRYEDNHRADVANRLWGKKSTHRCIISECSLSDGRSRCANRH